MLASASEDPWGSPRPESKLLLDDINQEVEAARQGDVEAQGQVIGTLLKHELHDDVALLVKVYNLVQGGNTNLLNSSSIIQFNSPLGNNTVLHLAAWHGNDEVVDLVVERAPKLLFSFNSNSDSALHVAARAGHISTVKKLLDAYANPQRHLEITKEWLAYRSLPYPPEEFDESTNMTELITLVEEKNEQGNNMLHEAIISSNSDAGAKIFKVLEEYTTEDNEGRSLSRSCYQFALKNLNNAKQSVLYLAVEAGLKETVNRILDKSPESDIPKGLSPVVAAIMKQDEDMLRNILDRKHEWIHLIDIHERLPLHYAASIGYRKRVQYLLNKCASCSIQRDREGFFPLHLASDGGHVDTVRLLLGNCPSPPEMLDRHGRNILHIAAKNGKLDLVRYILQTPGLKKMINNKDRDGNTPLHLATAKCHPKIVYTLTRDHSVNLDLVNRKKETAFDIAYTSYQHGKDKSLRQILTWTALKSAGAKVSPGKELKDHPVENTPSHSKSNQISQETVPDVRPSNPAPYKERVETLLVVSTLIVTASMTACFSVPGEANGSAYNLHQAMFHFFIFCITVSLSSSISATIILFWTRLGEIHLVGYALEWATPLLGVALTSLSMAFVAGIYTVIRKLSWLANLFLVMGAIFVLLVLFLSTTLFLPSQSTSKTMRYISSYTFFVLASLAEIRGGRDPRSLYLTQ